MLVMLSSEWFQSINIGIALDEGLASEGEEFSLFYGERIPVQKYVLFISK